MNATSAMKLMVYLFAFAVVIMVGCKKDEPTKNNNNNQNNTSGDCQLLTYSPIDVPKTYHFRYTNGLLTQIIHVDNNGNPIGYDNFKRNEKGLVTQIDLSKTNTPTTAQLRIYYFDDRIAKVERYKFDSLTNQLEWWITYEYLYGSRPLPDKIESTSGQEPWIHKETRKCAYDERNNLLAWGKLVANEDTGYVQRTYDTRKSPFLGLKLPFIPDLYPSYFWGPNNPSKLNFIGSNDPALKEATFTYEYNDKGYPLSYTLTPNYFGVKPKAIYTYDYK